ncbi:hypothetical protein V5O48_017032 [Marasmius crinis-equi]|uniref:DUF6589 domain-containing protein n=1 Tax=Marasmius crinis-equi TaxID=585013 RepID=A0ABR3EQ35_9AGAR
MIVKELQLQNYEWFWEWVQIVAGNQLSIARMRAIVNLRAGKEGGYSSFAWGVWIPGLFHMKMADMHGIFATHWGKSHCGACNPSSLAFHNEVLHRLPISPTSLPTFCVCRDLVYASLHSRVLHCLLLVSDTSSLEECAARIGGNGGQFKQYAREIWETYANSHQVHELRWERKAELARATDKLPYEARNDPNITRKLKPTTGDMVFENALLFLRDALMSREFSDTIKQGGSGQVLLVMKVFALSFRGNRRTKYAYETLCIIHNLTCVWPKPICDIVLNNWLLNPTGRSNSYVEVDLIQEHMNYWIKTYYKAHGSNASWKWIETIAPCVQALQHITKNMTAALGINIGNKHQTPDVANDIAQLMKSLDENEVYCVVPGHTTDHDDPPATNVIEAGLRALKSTSSNPLADYNTVFLCLQTHSQILPVVGDYPLDSSLPTSTAIPTHDQAPLATTSAASNTSQSQRKSQLRCLIMIQTQQVGRQMIRRSQNLEVFLLELDGEEEEEPTLELASEEDGDLDMDGDDTIGGLADELDEFEDDEEGSDGAFE